MAKKINEEKPKKEKKPKEKKEKGEKKDIVFDLSDGVTWHDFVGLVILFFVFIWKIIRLILAPFFWVYDENIRMIRFVRATSHERTMTEDERVFVESLPLIFTMTGAVGGVIIGVLAAAAFQENCEKGSSFVISEAKQQQSTIIASTLRTPLWRSLWEYHGHVGLTQW